MTRLPLIIKLPLALVFFIFNYSKAKTKKLFKKFRKKRPKKYKVMPSRQATKIVPTELYELNKNLPSKIIYRPGLSGLWLATIRKKYSWDKFDIYDNMYHEYIFTLLEPIQNSENTSEKIFFYNLTKEQRVFYVFSTFINQIDNGGVKQFFYNTPELIVAISDALIELKLNDIRSDYEKELSAFFQVDNALQNIKAIIFDKQKWEAHWNSFFADFRSGKTSSKSLFDSYFFKEEYKKTIFKAMVDYVDNHKDKYY